MAQYCRKCGNLLKENAKFCGKCGEPAVLPEPEKPIIQEEIQKPVSPVPEVAEEITEHTEQKKEDKKIPVWIYAAAAVAILLIGIFVGRGMSSPKETKGEVTGEPSAEPTVDSVYELQFPGMDQAGNLSVLADHAVMDCSEFAVASEDGIISAEPNELDLSKPGSYKVVFTCEWPDHPDQTVTEEKTVHIIDGDPPVISVKENEIRIEAGSDYNPKDNVKEAYDSLDGELAYSDTEKAGSYTISGNRDFSEAGVYQLSAIALDAAGNRTSTEFTVKVFSEQRFVAIPEGCSSKRTDYDTLFAEMKIYGKEYTSPAYSTKSEMEHALREFEKEKYPGNACQVYPAVHVQDGNESQWIFYDYNPWDG